jgi:hypothetical protein
MIDVACRACGCTDENACLVDVRTGDVVKHLNADQQIDFDAGADENVNVEPCYWVEHDLCSACVQSPAPPPLLVDLHGRPLRGAP